MTYRVLAVGHDLGERLGDFGETRLGLRVTVVDVVFLDEDRATRHRVHCVLAASNRLKRCPTVSAW